MTKETRIPFSGFYESYHSRVIEEDLERAFQNDREESLIPEELQGAFWMDTNVLPVEIEYVKQYVEQLNDLLPEEINITFKEMTSPKEYNYETDKIYCNIPEKDVVYMLDTMLKSKEIKEQFAALIKERFTSRSGFHSFYSNDINEWLCKTVLQWDYNEIYTLLEIFVLEASDGTDYEEDIIEYIQGNPGYDVMQAIPEKYHQYSYGNQN